MVALSTLLNDVRLTASRGDMTTEVTSVVFDSRKSVPDVYLLLSRGQALTVMSISHKLLQVAPLRSFVNKSQISKLHYRGLLSVTAVMHLVKLHQTFLEIRHVNSNSLAPPEQMVRLQ